MTSEYTYLVYLKGADETVEINLPYYALNGRTHWARTLEEAERLFPMANMFVTTSATAFELFYPTKKPGILLQPTNTEVAADPFFEANSYRLYLGDIREVTAEELSAEMVCLRSMLGELPS